MYQLLAMDLDGTLLNKENLISQRNCEAIQKAIAKGVHVVICSGRSYMSLQYFEKEIGLNKKGFYGIAFNGVVVYETDTHTILRDIRMKHSLAMDIIKELRQFDVGLVCYEGEKLLVEVETETIKTYATKSRIPYQKVEDFGQIQSDISKVLARGSNEELQKVHRHFGSLCDPRYNCYFTSSDLFEFTHILATKGSGVAFLADYLQIPIAHVITIGDHVNDMSMIEAAGLGVAVQNAIPELKQAAQYITTLDNNEGAVAEVIERFIL